MKMRMKCDIRLACGGVTGVVPTLLTEIAPTSMRGKITTLHQLQVPEMEFHEVYSSIFIS